MKKPILDLTNLTHAGTIAMDKIEWWLLKYSEEYKETCDFVQSQHWTEQEDGTPIRLPPFWKQSEEDIFVEIYTELEKIAKFHKNENYFEQEIKAYHKIEHLPNGLKKWITKNETLGAEEYLDFYINYLEYSENPKYLQVCINPLFSKEYIYVDLLNFKNTIKFIEIFDEFYWVENELNGQKKESDFTQT